MNDKKLFLTPRGDETEFYKKVADLLAAARQYAKRQLDSTIVTTYYEVGRMIVEREQQGQKRAQYGTKLIKGLAEYLTEQYGKGFSVVNLKSIRKFYQIYSPLIGQSLTAISENNDKYDSLISIFDANAQKGQSLSAQFKSPYVLEFTGLEERSEYNENELEQALIDNLQKFLLELGKGFLFEARQKRFSFDDKSFYVDLVFYNRLLQCYVLVDLKVAELKHQDLGQMLMYVNYFDRYVRQTFEKPTIGILLCSQKNDNIVELTLPEDSNIYASAYSLYLPDKALLQRKLAEWVEEFEEEHGGDGK